MVEKISAHFAELMIAKMESLTTSWNKPWISNTGVLPYNLVSGKKYSGTNILMLLMLTEAKGYRTPVFLSFKQAKERGLQVKKGEKQFPVVFWKPFYAAIAPGEGRRCISVEEYRKLKADEQLRYKLQFTLRYFLVLNLDQTDFEERCPEQWAKILKQQDSPAWPAGADHPALEQMLEAQSWVCPIDVVISDRAYYAPARDRIVVPKKEQFRTTEAFYSVLLHEMAHSTGIEKRLKRYSDDVSREAYGREELVAEFSAALIGCGIGISSSIRNDNVAYLKVWLEQIRKQPSFILSVLNDVCRVVRFFSETLELELFSKGEQAEDFE